MAVQCSAVAAAVAASRLLLEVEVLAGHTGHAKHARARVGAKHRPDLAHQKRWATHDLFTAGSELVSALRVTSVLYDPSVLVVLFELVEVFRHSLKDAL